MSEEILKALAQLFAIITRQGGGKKEKQTEFVENYFSQELNYEDAEKYINFYKQAEEEKYRQDTLMSVKDSVKTLALCRKISKTLSQKQKVIVLVKLLELVYYTEQYNRERLSIINTTADIFKIPKEEYAILKDFVKEDKIENLNHPDILLFDEKKPFQGSVIKYIDSKLIDGEIIFIRQPDVNIYFAKYNGNDEIYLNSRVINKNVVYLFSPGSVFKTPKGEPLYYSDLVATYNSDIVDIKIAYDLFNVNYNFPNGVVALRDINLSARSGQLIGIMGSSGAGKTTLLNVMSGMDSPLEGSVQINGNDIYKQKSEIEGVIGYVAQEDLLIQELTVYENLYYNAKLCFKGLSNADVNKKVEQMLDSLNLLNIKHLRVGSVLNKKISGGQRKRLNIALELIREPLVLFVDEPTSGLSSRDSENVIDLLKELCLKGKLIFTVIHQPSSDIYKMFDKMMILDTGGYPIFFGNPVESIIYFKHHVDKQVGLVREQCHVCGNINPEQIFNVIEAKVVNEYGQYTNQRKRTPQKLYKQYKESFTIERIPTIDKKVVKQLNQPSILSQIRIFTTRDFLSKISNIQYVLINLLEAPVLALLLALIIKYSSGGHYIFQYNDNIPAYILISIIIALFMGLTVSAEEIIHDRKILKREKFLNLSKMAYLTSKLAILFTLSLIQTFMLTMVGNMVLEVDWSLYPFYWLMLFTVSCHANLIGLNISSTFNSAVTVYIIIPLLLIPELILSGIIFDYDKLNNTISDRGEVPIIADVMASRWAYEAIAVKQYKGNQYMKNLFEVEFLESSYDFKNSYSLSYLEDMLNNIRYNLENLQDDSIKTEVKKAFFVLNHEFQTDPFLKKYYNSDEFASLSTNIEMINEDKIDMVLGYIYKAKDAYLQRFLLAMNQKDSILALTSKVLQLENSNLEAMKNKYTNDKLNDLLRNVQNPDKIIVKDNRLVQLKDPIYYLDVAPKKNLDYRSHFFAHKKHLFNKYFDTYYFNLSAIWLLTIILYICLYYGVIPMVINIFKR